MNKTMDYKTPIYQRKAYNDYLVRKKDDEEFIAKRKANQKKYYEKNREKIIAKVKARTEKIKNEKNPPPFTGKIITFD
jgi:anion-transporting  ArsA/GET3 family ATPase